MVGDRSVAVALLWTATFLLAGCLGDGSGGKADAKDDVQLPPSEVKNEDPAVAQPARIEGLVKDSLGSPVAEVLLALKGTSGSVDLQASSDAEGAFVFDGLPNGTYAVTATKTGYEPAQAPFVLGPGETKSLEITITALAVEDAFSYNTTILDGNLACGYQLPRVGNFNGQSDNVCDAAPSSTGDNTVLRFVVPAGAKAVVTEIVWTKNAENGASRLYATLEALGAGEAWRGMNESANSSPISMRIREGEEGLDESFPFEQADQNVTWRVRVSTTGSGSSAEVIRNQAFQVYATAFWGQIAPENFTALPPA